MQWMSLGNDVLSASSLIFHFSEKRLKSHGLYARLQADIHLYKNECTRKDEAINAMLRFEQDSRSACFSVMKDDFVITGHSCHKVCGLMNSK